MGEKVDTILLCTVFVFDPHISPILIIFLFCLEFASSVVSFPSSSQGVRGIFFSVVLPVSEATVVFFALILFLLLEPPPAILTTSERTGLFRIIPISAFANHPNTGRLLCTLVFV